MLENAILEQLVNISSAIGELRADMENGFKEIRKEFNNEISGIKQEMSGMKQEMSCMKKDIADVRQIALRNEKNLADFRKEFSENVKDTSEIFFSIFKALDQKQDRYA